MENKPSKLSAVLKIIIIDGILLAAVLLSFAYFHHVKEEAVSMPPLPNPTFSVDGESLELSSDESLEEFSEESFEEPSEPISEEPSEPISKEPEPPTIYNAAERYKDKFADGETVSTASEYKSKYVSVTLKEFTYEGKLYFVQDIYITNIESLSAGFASNYNDTVLNISKQFNAVCAINGDYCFLKTEKQRGAIIRNGVNYRKDVNSGANHDVCIIYKDGTMKIVPKDEYNTENELEKGAWHAWDFGPHLLDEGGNAIEDFSFRSDISKGNPRTAIGYFDPGHYCFVTVGGRADGTGYGVKLTELSAFMKSLGCTVAYNLDGGQSAVMVQGETVVNEKYQGQGRDITDIVFIRDF